MKNIAVQSFLRPALTPVIRCKDYTVFLETMERIDRVLIDSSLEREAIVKALEGWDEAGGKDRERRALRAIKALRVEVVRHLLGGISFRCLSQELGRSELLANFCRVREVDGIRKISKSSLERDSKFFDEAYLRQLHARMTEVVGNAEHCGEAGLEKPIDTRECLIDATCLEANIHWPVDWVLLKDVGATLLKAISLIRQAGMKQRMPQGAKGLAREMNKRCLEMTHARRRREAGKARKGILRRMKLLLKKIDIGIRLPPKSSRIWDSLYSIELVEAAKGSKEKKCGLCWTRRDQACDENAQLLGCSVLRTNRHNFGGAQLWRLYMTLTRAEDGFKALKSDLGLRPNHHQIEPRVEGHVFITILAYQLLRFIEYTLERHGDTRCWQTIKRVLQTHTYATVILPTRQGEVYRLRKAGIPEQSHKQIYNLFQIQWKKLPVKKSMSKIKIELIL